MPVNRKRILWIVVAILLFMGGIAGGFFYFSRHFGSQQTAETLLSADKEREDASFVRIYYPSGGRLIMEERKVKRQVSVSAIAEEIMGQFLKGPSAMEKSSVPPGTKLLAVYHGNDGILYVDLSDEFRRNFRGDALAEFLLLKGLYDSIISNVTGVDDVKVIIEGKELESIGGHFLSLYPLKNIVSEVR